MTVCQLTFPADNVQYNVQGAVVLVSYCHNGQLRAFGDIYARLMCSKLALSGPSCPLPPCLQTTTEVIAIQPTTTTYVQPTPRRTNETIPTIGLIFTIIHLSGCFFLGNVTIFVCLVPALICAIVVSIHHPNAHISEWGREGQRVGPTLSATTKQYYHIIEGLSRVDS